MVQPRIRRRNPATRRLALKHCRRGDSPVLATDQGLDWNKGRIGDLASWVRDLYFRQSVGFCYCNKKEAAGLFQVLGRDGLNDLPRAEQRLRHSASVSSSVLLASASPRINSTGESASTNSRNSRNTGSWTSASCSTMAMK